MITQRLDQLYQLVKEARGTVRRQSASMDETIAAIHAELRRSISQGKRVFVIGNGGSAGLASHHAVDLVNVVKAAAVSVVEPGLLSCIANDYGYEFTFSRPLETLAQPGDVLVAISSSGKSKNILNACDVMRAKGGVTIALSGFAEDNPLRRLGDISVWTGINDYGLVEAAHFFILHTIVDTWKTGPHE